MVMRPLSLPRTLKGVGGIRLINMPGVKYPDKVLYGKKGTDVSTGKPYEVVPPCSVSSKEAASMLGLPLRSARSILNRNRVKCMLVAQAGKTACMYWDRKGVEHLLSLRLPMVQQIPESYCTAKEACCILVVARSSLTRYVQRGWLKEHPLRLLTQSGVRTLSFFLRAEVRMLSARLNAARSHTRNIQHERLHRDWYLQRETAFLKLRESEESAGKS